MRRGIMLALLWQLFTSPAFAQDPSAALTDRTAAPASRWTFMQDGILFVMFNDQDSSRGERELRAPNWWMGMGQRPIKSGVLTVDVMLSLDRATVGAEGYSHIFQIGETFNGIALIDHQHPHDFLMQLAAVWRQPLARGVA